jgi:hypothetical protein
MTRGNIRSCRKMLFHALSAMLITLACTYGAWAQTLTTGAIAGNVADQSGATVPSAKVTAKSLTTGEVRTTTTSTAGTYNFAQLLPGQYQVRVQANGFKAQNIGPVAVAISQTSTVNFKLEVGAATQTIEVTAGAELIQTNNPNTTTTVTSTAISNLPNPGMDLSYVAQVSAGAVMNTSGGYGNVEFNGLPSGSTNFTIDGLDANDPFLNLNNSGATNLQLGLNDVQETTVNTLSYSLDQGRQGAAQVNYVSKSGSNDFHGNAYEIWNGSPMNATNYFLNATGASNLKPFSNLNQFGGSVGGPIKKDKLFFFFDYEATRIVVPTTQNETYPTAAFDQYTLGALQTGGYDPLTGVTYAPAQNVGAETTYYKQVFNLYGQPSGGTPVPTNGCPIFTNGTFVPLTAGLSTPPVGDGCALHRVFGITNHTNDRLYNIRIDNDINADNRVWYKFSNEAGLQATYTDPVNSVFNAYSSQPQSTAAIGYTHIFSPTIVNEFNPGVYWYSAIFEPTNFAAANAASPIEFAGGGAGFTNIYGAGTAWPQGRNVTDYQLIDNLTWTKGTHELKFGENFRRTLASNHDLGSGTLPYTQPNDIVQWSLGISQYAQQSFPLSTDEPLGIYGMDFYGMDTWKARPSLTITYGLRGTINSNPASQRNQFAQLNTDFLDLTHNVNTPLNQMINPDVGSLFYGTQAVVWQPRVSLAWQAKPDTVIRSGVGYFSDVFPAFITDQMLRNFPNNNGFTSGIGGALSNAIYAVPGAGNDVVAAMGSANQALRSGFASGVASCAVSNAANCIPQSNYFSVPKGTFPYPYFLEWSFSVEHQFSPNFLLTTQYVGTKATQLDYSYAADAFQNICAGCFSPFPANPVDPRFGAVTELSAGANSNYNGLQVTAEKRFSHGLMFNVNYTYSRCFDEVSNGGLFGFSGAAITSPLPGLLGRDYGPCDFDTRHAFNLNYVYTLPFHSGNHLLNQVVGGWQVSGDAFYHSGFPFTPQSAGYSAGGLGIFNGGSALGNGGFPQFANAVAGQNAYVPIGTVVPGVTQPGTVQYLNPSAFVSVVDPSTGACLGGTTPTACQFGNVGRNSLVGPGFVTTDFFITKRFKVTERTDFRIDVQAYNLFNHPNFGYPGSTYGVPGEPGTLVNVGTINTMATPPTGLLGSFLGGDTSVRMIALSGRFEF